MTSSLIRNSEPMDVPAITRIYAHAVTHGTASFELEPPDEAAMGARHRAVVEAGFPFLVVEFDAVVVGFAYAGPYRPRHAYRFSVEDSVYVDPLAQRRGVGRLLLERLIAESERRGFRQMIAVIGHSAQTASIELHRAAGFHIGGTVQNVGFKFERWLDTVLMQRALGAGAKTAP